MSTVEDDSPPPPAAVKGSIAAAGDPEEPEILISIPSAWTARRRRVQSSSPFIMGVVLLLVYLAFTIKEPSAFPSLGNDKNMLMDASTLLVMGTAMTFVMVAGGIDLSIGSVLVFAGVCSDKVMNHMGAHSAFTVIVGVIIALAAGLLWGLFNGLCITKLRVPPLITTLGTLGAALGVADLMTDGNDISTIPPVLITVETSHLLGISWIVWVALLVTLVGGLVLAVTRFGRHTYVIGSNAEAARRAGLNVDRHLLALYSFSGMAAGLAGMLSLTRFATTTIDGHSTDALQVITGVVLGGTSLFGGIGTILGTLVGICIPTVLNNGLVVINVQSFWQQVAIGFILIAAVYIDQLKRRQRDRA